MHRLISVMSGLGVALLLCAPPASADLVKCNSGIEKNGAKLQSAIVKALQKCKNAFQKVGTADAATAASCNTTFSKAVDVVNNPASTMAKTIAALHSLGPAALGGKDTCTDDDLGKLGHMSTKLFDTRWERWVALSALKAAYEEQIWLVGDMVNVLLDLGATGSCPLCNTLAVPPCAKVACTLGAGSQIQTIILGGTLTPAFSGVAIFEGCQFPGLFSGDQIATIGNPSLGIKPVDVFGNGSIIACTVGLRTEGVTTCTTTGAPRIDYHSCQDHVIESSVDECEVALGTPGPNQVLNCAADSADSHHTGITNGGACALFTKISPAPVGSSFALNTSQLTIVMPGQFGTDGTVCTPDDTATPAMPAVIPITSGTVQSEVYDYGQGTCNPDPCALSPSNVTKTVGPLTGSPVPGATPCSQLRQGNLAGLTLVGAFPALDTRVSATALSDSVTSIKLVCQ